MPVSAVVQLRPVAAPIPPKPIKGRAVAVFSKGVVVVGDMTQQSFTKFAADMHVAMKGKGHDE